MGFRTTQNKGYEYYNKMTLIKFKLQDYYNG